MVMLMLLTLMLMLMMLMMLMLMMLMMLMMRHVRRTVQPLLTPAPLQIRPPVQPHHHRRFWCDCLNSSILADAS